MYDCTLVQVHKSLHKIIWRHNDCDVAHPQYFNLTVMNFSIWCEDLSESPRDQITGDRLRDLIL